MTERCAEEALSAWLDGELSRAEQVRVAVHLEACEPCRLELAQVRRVRAQLRSLPERQVPEGLFDALARTEPGPEPDMSITGGRGRTVLGGIVVVATVLTLLASAGDDPPPRAVEVPVEAFVVDGQPAGTAEGPGPVPVLAPGR